MTMGFINILIVRNSTGKTKGYKDSAGNEYLDLYNVGDGDGYFITNGYARKIYWHKETRTSQTIYKYEDGTEVKVNDGKTYINQQIEILVLNRSWLVNSFIYML